MKTKDYIKKLTGQTEYQKFHEKTKFTKLGRNVHPKFWPQEWKTIFYKAYPRFEEIVLPKPDLSAKISFENTLKSRRSYRTFSKKSLSLAKLSSFLYYSAGLSPNKIGLPQRRFYPSPGGRFSIEIYIVSLNSELPKGVYHYYVKNNSLEKLLDFKKGDLKSLSNQYWIKKAGCLIIMTTIFKRNTNKYGERGYRHVLVEAGHIGQNLYLLATALNLAVCGVGGYIDDNVNKFLDIDGKNESVIYVLAVGEKVS